MGATSGATPIVTSLAALVRSLRPDLKAADVVEIIRKGCDDIGEEGYDIYTGCGRVNFRKTLELAKGWKE
jgi:subtilisin family serine protease